jgi:hypothetical protein
MVLTYSNMIFKCYAYKKQFVRDDKIKLSFLINKLITVCSTLTMLTLREFVGALTTLETVFTELQGWRYLNNLIVC